MNIKILVCCHKKDVMANQEPYFPIHVGKAKSNVDLGIQGDDTGENISVKNDSYCELTGMYWAWKNLKVVDYIGLCHYRRYFDFYKRTKRFLSATTLSTSELGTTNLDIPDYAQKKLNDGYVIVAKKQTYRVSNFHEYSEFHVSDDIKLLRRIFEESYESKYLVAFDKLMFSSNKLSPFNMFIMGWPIFEEYCKWLFPLLQRIENNLNIANYTQYQKRVFGFLSERLLNIYLEAEGIRTIEYPILLFDDNSKSISYIKEIINIVRSNIGFFFIKQH